MAYIKNEWKTGDTIFAINLNHMEDGIEAANSGKVLSVTIEDNTMNKTWKQINDCLVGGGIVFENLLQEQEGVSVAGITILKSIFTNYNSSSNEPYIVGIEFDGESDTSYYYASTQDDYPMTKSGTFS